MLIFFSPGYIWKRRLQTERTDTILLHYFMSRKGVGYLICDWDKQNSNAPSAIHSTRVSSIFTKLKGANTHSKLKVWNFDIGSKIMCYVASLNIAVLLSSPVPCCSFTATLCSSSVIHRSSMLVFSLRSFLASVAGVAGERELTTVSPSTWKP